jgi:hypothetical protein
VWEQVGGAPVQHPVRDVEQRRVRLVRDLLVARAQHVNDLARVAWLEPLAEHPTADLFDTLAPVEPVHAVSVVVQVAADAAPDPVGLGDLLGKDRRQEPVLAVEVAPGVALLGQDVLDDLGQLVPRAGAPRSAGRR